MQGEGYCECGCGGLAPIAHKTCTKRGYVKGKPRRFIAGHHTAARDVAERFWEKVDKGAPGECWMWAAGSAGAHPYGVLGFKVGGRTIHKYAHRIAYELEVGPIPEGLEIDHLCRNKRCVNPAHLEPVTHPENVRRGPRVKLTQQDADAIRASSEPRAVLAARYGIAKRYVNAVRRGDYWA